MTRPHLSVSRSTVLIATLVSIVLACRRVPAPSAAPASPQDARSTYRNPLEPKVPGDGIVESCADPVVLRGPRSRDRHRWFMYCTTDPLNDTDTDVVRGPGLPPAPDAGQHVYLVTGATSATRCPTPTPSWAAPGCWTLGAGPRVLPRGTDRYYLTVRGDRHRRRGERRAGAAPVTVPSASRASTSPTGPWRVSRSSPSSPRDGRVAGLQLLLDLRPRRPRGQHRPRSSVLYYGSYYGGVFGQRGDGHPERHGVGRCRAADHRRAGAQAGRRPRSPCGPSR